MKVFELMSILEKFPADHEVLVKIQCSRYTSIEKISGGDFGVWISGGDSEVTYDGDTSEGWLSDIAKALSEENFDFLLNK